MEQNVSSIEHGGLNCAVARVAFILSVKRFIIPQQNGLYVFIPSFWKAPQINRLTKSRKSVLSPLEEVRIEKYPENESTMDDLHFRQFAIVCRIARHNLGEAIRPKTI